MSAGAPEGNNNVVKGKAWRMAIRNAVAHKYNSTYSEGLAKIAAKLVDAAADGEQWAIKEIAEREDGKAAQGVIVSGDEDGGPIKAKVTVEFREAKKAQ